MMQSTESIYIEKVFVFKHCLNILGHTIWHNYYEIYLQGVLQTDYVIVTYLKEDKRYQSLV